MKGWERTDLPRVVAVLTYVHGAVVVGSQAECFERGEVPNPEKDWDLFVPFVGWRRAVMSIPKTAVPNGNRGWRFTVDGVGVDVWPDELARYLEEATSPRRIRAKAGPAFAVDLRHGLVFRAQRSA